MRRLVAALLISLGALLAQPVWAQSHGPSTGALDKGHPPGRGPASSHDASKAPSTGHGAPGAAADSKAHEGGKGHADPNAPPGDINWWRGLLFTSDAPAESFLGELLFRPKSMPPPFLANVINICVFGFIIYRLGKKPLLEALTKRKEGIVRDIETAQKMKKDAEERLASYEEKLANIDREIERIRNDFREQGERDRERIIKDAEEKRARMLKDATFLIEQEAKQLRVTLTQETVEAAVRAASKVLSDRIASPDHDRLSDDFLKQVASATGAAPSKGGSA